MFKGFIFGIAAFLLFLGNGPAATIYVPDDYPTIQDAINASVNDDTIIVRPGTYVENLDFLGKAIQSPGHGSRIYATRMAGADGHTVGQTVEWCSLPRCRPSF